MDHVVHPPPRTHRMRWYRSNLYRRRNAKGVTISVPAGRVRNAGAVVIITAFFGALWGVIGALALPSGSPLVVALVTVVTVALLVCAARFFRTSRRLPQLSEHPDGTNPFRTRAYRLAVLFEIVAIPVSAVVLNNTGHPGAVVSAVAAIVGLHFFGLIPAFRSWQFAALGGAMVLLAFFSLLFPSGVDASGTNLRGAVVGLGCALLLWASVLPLVVSTWRASNVGSE